MSNFRQDILNAANGEAILGIVLSDPNHWRDERPFNGYDGEKTWPIPDDAVDIVLPWATVAPWLDREYDDGYGGQDCPSIYAWTSTRVLFVGTYDGATWVSSIPRNPSGGAAHSVGGG